MTETEAYTAMRTHHQLLSDQLGTLADAVSQAAVAGWPQETAVADMITYLAEQVLPHAAAEEDTIYPAVAARHDDLAGTVSEMLAEHETLSAAAEALAGQADGGTAAGQAREIAELFAAHAARENDVLLPALLGDSDVDLAALLAQMHRRVGEIAQAGAAPGTAVRDPQAIVLQILLNSVTALARAGQASLACRLAAAAWAALREDRPDLAVRVTAALHGLTRRLPSQPGQPVQRAERAQRAGSPDSARGEAAGSGPIAADPDLDVRDLSPARRHETIFAAYEALQPGEGFVLINDHDPKPLWYQFEAEQAGRFTWDSLEAGPMVWRVRIGRPPMSPLRQVGHRPGQFAPSTQDEPGDRQDGGDEPELDVRQLAHLSRHDVIFTAYRELPPAAGFVLVNDHDPVPLRYQFEAQYPDEFSWDYLESGPTTWRVRIGHAATTDDGRSGLPQFGR
jgi:uncharacterized protein (DUF2249 family)/hemerythrin-like domain-containing protein